jgi:hypothetical protein
LFSKGILVFYRDSQYKKKIQLTVDPNLILDGDELDENNVEKLLRKLEKHISGYFGGMYALDDFNLNKMHLVTDIDVGTKGHVAAYVKTLRRIGRVKGFSSSRNDEISKKIGFCLGGNSNHIEFLIYDLEAWLKEQRADADPGKKQLKEMVKKSEGLLRAEVRLMKAQIIRDYANSLAPSNQILELSGKLQKIFLETFTRIVPFGDFHKKDQAVEIIRREVTDKKMTFRMLRLVSLVPEKKSLLLAQKALSYRKIDNLMAEFREIELSPVALSKRHDVQKLDNLYKYM